MDSDIPDTDTAVDIPVRTDMVGDSVDMVVVSRDHTEANTDSMEHTEADSTITEEGTSQSPKISLKAH